MDEPPEHIVKAAYAMCRAEGLDPDELDDGGFQRWQLYVRQAVLIEAALPHLIERDVIFPA